MLLRITPAGLAALGTEADSAPESGPALEGGFEPAEDAGPADAAPEARAEARTRQEGTKQAQLIAMVRQVEGATIDEIVASTRWQSHTIRGAFAGALKKRLGLTVTSEKEESRGRVYRLDL